MQQCVAACYCVAGAPQRAGRRRTGHEYQDDPATTEGCGGASAIRLPLTFSGCGRYRWWALGALAALLITAGGEMVHAGFRKPARLPAWPEPKPGDRLLIIAPHPDDEALAAGGVIQRAIARGARVRIVVLTDGDAF